MDIFTAPADFNRRIIGIEAPDLPTPLPYSRRKAIADHLREEAQELEDAEELKDQVDALTDVMFIAGGRFYETGTDGPAHCAETSRANTTRVRGDNPKRPNSFGFDAVKPEGWQEPDHQSIIDRTFCGKVAEPLDLAQRPLPFGFPSFHHVATRRPKVIVLGHARHGKDTVAELLRDRYGYRFQSSSMFCAEHVMLPYFRGQGVDYPSVEACYEDRVNHRATWYDQIEAYNRDDWGRLCRELFAQGNDVYVGTRSSREFAEARKAADVVLWVDAQGRGLPPEPRSSFDIDYDPASMTYVSNNGTLKMLEAAVDALVHKGVL